MPDAGNGGFALGLSQTPYTLPFSYTTIRNKLLTLNNGIQAAAYSVLPATTPFANSTLWVSTAQQKALGFSPGGGIAGEDGVIGIISNEELAAGGFTGDWTQSTPANNSQFYMIGTIEHELSEIMGRVSFDSTNAINNASSYSIMDLFRFKASNTREVSDDASPAYFSTDNGVDARFYWNTDPLAGDLGDWAPNGPGNTHPTGNDAFLNDSFPGVVNGISANDKDLMNVLGWNVSPPSPPPPPPPPTGPPPASPGKSLRRAI